LRKINEFKIQRNINPGNSSQKFDLAGFDDASERAYGACLYAISKNAEDNQQIIFNLLKK